MKTPMVKTVESTSAVGIVPGERRLPEPDTRGRTQVVLVDEAVRRSASGSCIPSF